MRKTCNTTPFLEIAGKLKKILSPNILQVYDYGKYGDQLFLVLEYAKGGDLGAILKTRTLSQIETIQLGLDLLKGLKVLKDNKMVHFDIKPANIMHCPPEYKLGDFGIVTTRQTETVPLYSEIWSTAAYVAPEFFTTTNSVDYKSDIYSLGVTMYQALIGDNPFQAEKAIISMARHVNFIPPPIRIYNKNFSLAFSKMIAKMLSKNPSERPSPEELERGLKATLKHLRRFAKLDPTVKDVEPCEVIWTRGEEDEEVEISLPKQVKRSFIPKAILDFFRRGILRIQEVILGRIIEIQEKIYNIFVIKGSTFIVVIFIAAFSFSIILGYLVHKFMTGGFTPSPKGSWVVTICKNCGLTEEWRIQNIAHHKCSECNGVLSYGMECLECGCLFSLKATFETENKEILMEKLDDRHSCLRCGSLFTRPIRTYHDKIAILNSIRKKINPNFLRDQKL